MNKEDKLYYISSLNEKFNKLASIKTSLLETQNVLVDEDVYTDEMEEDFENLDIALENAKELIDSLISRVGVGLKD